MGLSLDLCSEGDQSSEVAAEEESELLPSSSGSDVDNTRFVEDPSGTAVFIVAQCALDPIVGSGPESKTETGNTRTRL